MPHLTIATPVLPGACEHLPDLAASVRAAQRGLTSAGWDCDWVVVVDGPGALPRFGTTESTRMVRLPQPQGVAAARNVAAVNGRGDWVLTADCDQTLVVPGLVGMLMNPVLGEAGWALANHVRSDGSRGVSWRPVTDRWQPGAFAAAWSAGAVGSVGSLLTRTEVVLAVGGWPAVADDDNLAFTLLAGEQFPGVGLTDVVARLGDRRPADVPPEGRWVLDALVNGRRALLGREAVHAPRR